MKTSPSIVALLALLVAATSCGGDQSEPSVSAEKVAAAYFEALTKGDAARANELATVPFSVDGKKVFTTDADLADFHKSVKSKKGARDVPEYTVEKGSADDPRWAKDVLSPGQFPAHDLFEVAFTRSDGKKSGVVIFVTKGDTPKVIGFVD